MELKTIHQYCGKLKNHNNYKTDRVDFLVRSDRSILNACGVYAIWFGDKVYIGQSTCISERMVRHSDSINRGLRGKKIEVMYNNILKHLLQNNFIVAGYIDVMEICSPEQLTQLENKYISIYKKKGVCLNRYQRGNFSKAMKSETKPSACQL